MSTNNPSPSQIQAAMLDHGVDFKTYKGWDTIGRPWRGPDGSPGLTGAVVHHTATASATGNSGAPSLWWAVNAYDKPVCNLLVGRGPGDTYLLSAGSAYHCGLGGPIPELGVWSHGYYGQTRLFGIEIDDAGVSKDSITDYQIEQTARTLAALAELCDWNVDKAILTHGCYTNGCHTDAKKPLPSIGRKNDTLEQWGGFPGDPRPQPYNAPFWRQEVNERLAGVVDETWDGTVPTLDAARNAFNSLDTDTVVKNKAAWRVACRLYDLGIRTSPAKPLHEQGWPRKEVKAYRESIGWTAGNGGPSDRLWKRLFGKTK